MHASLFLVFPLLSFAFGQSGGCESGAVTADRCCDGDVITSDGKGIDTSDISNLVCCTGGSGSSFNFGGSSCAAGQTPVPFSQLPMAGNAGSSQGTTVIVSNDMTSMESATPTDTMMTSSAMSSSPAETTTSDTMTSSAMAGTESSPQSSPQSTTDSSTGAAAMMTSGPVAGALMMAGGLMMVAL
ncbi:uncharacterized protein RCC_03096 [Ramularia collo-cygni]|uniref:Uncharacterized protein n=1 Tax=Ramularia collo-cygni TaxID=112498 RepID=A0A2D3VA10_9PEZI|nr:uncharacterized protein RCC_03096 [Ramularia collo-cygni]CZT17263.1 uncharacterized protein RCC_03096 [Ramularia collo-cygni]